MKKRRRRRHRSRSHSYHSAFRREAEGRVRILEVQRELHELAMQAVVTPDVATDEGMLVKAVTPPWLKLIHQMELDPHFMFQIDPRKWEEIVAGAYKEHGFDDVVLTPRSGDYGRDVIATKRGLLSVRIVGQMKRYKPGLVVTADEVRAFAHVVTNDHKTSKGVITTTSDFAPKIPQDPTIAPYLDTRLELINGPKLLKWLGGLRAGR